MGKVLDTAGDVSDILAQIEAARAKGRIDTAGINQNQANAGANIYRTQSAVALAGPEQSARAAALGDTMANVQPFSWTGGTKMVGNIPVPQSTGGLTPANFGPATRKAGADLATLSANRVSSPAFNLPKAPVLAPLPSASGADSVLGTASTIGSLLKALGGGAGKSAGSGSPGGSGGGGNLADLWKIIHPGDPDAGSPQHQDEDTRPGADVSTDTTFNGVPGGYGNNPEDPMSADPDWWKQFLGDSGSDGGPNPYGDPGPQWGG